MAEENQVAEPQQTPSEPVTEVNWKESLPDDLREDPSLKSIQDVPGLAKSYIHAQKMVGADKIPVPTEHATQEDWNAVYEKLGRPDSPEGYQIEGEATEIINEFKPIAHQLGLNNNQVTKLVEFYNAQQETATNNAQVDLQQYQAESEAAMRKELGRAYDTKMKSASRVAQNIFTKDQLDKTKLSDGSRLGDNPMFLKAMIKVSDMISEDRPISNPQEMILTPDQAREKMDAAMAPGSPYWDKTHPNHAKAVEDVMNLREMVHGN
jgi:hypothetical protein